MGRLSPLSVFLFLLFSLSDSSHLPEPCEEDPLFLYSNELRQDLRKQIGRSFSLARESIQIAMFSFTDSSLLSLLEERGKEGISVSLVCDAQFSSQLLKKCPPHVQSHFISMEGLMHEKLVVIDEQYIWLGSCNFTDDSLRNHGNLMIWMRAPELGKILSEHINALKRGENLSHFPSREIIGTAHPIMLELFLLPDQGQGEQKILSLLRQARSSIQMQMFTWTHLKYAEAVINAHLRGVRVAAVIDRNLGRGVGKGVVQKLVEAGVPVKYHGGFGLHHYKWICIDQSILVTGSANWTRAAFSKNRDLFLVISPLPGKQRQRIDRLMNLHWAWGEEVAREEKAA